MLEKIKNLDRRWIFLFVLLAVIIPLLVPIGLKINTSKPVRNIYEYMDKLPEGSVIMLSFDYGPSTKIEIGPAAEALVRHAFSKNLKIVGICLWPDGVQLSRKLFLDLGKEYNKVYGKDYVNLGYKSGGSVILIGMGGGIAKTFPADVDGTALSDIPLMNKVKDLSNIALDVSLSAGVPGMKEHVMIVSTQYNVPVAASCTAVSAPEMYTFLNSGQLLGLMGGLKGAAEYEALMNIQGEARKGMDAQSIVHLVIIMFIIFSNIVYFAGEYRQKKIQ